MTLLAIMAVCRVTRGAVTGVPISGVTGARLARQDMSLASLAPGTARSEPHGPPAGTPGRARTVQCGTVSGGVPGVAGCTMVGAGCAH